MTCVLCVAAQRREVYCQTFVRAHIQRLPANTVKELYMSEIERSIERPRIVTKFLVDNCVDVMLAEFGDTGVDVMEACHAARVPLVVRFGGADAYCVNAKWQRLRPYYLPLFNTAAAIVAVSRDMERQLIGLGVPPTKLHYCPSGADTELFYGAQPSTSQPVFAAVGRFVDKKAPCLTLLAFSSVVKTCPQARLVMAGDGYLLESCERLAKALRIETAVKFRGASSHEEVASIMRTARCFVQHSVRANDGDSEGTPNSVMEAGAMGLPVVATRHAGIADVVIDGQTGYLVNEGDVDLMAEYMFRLAVNAELAGVLGARAQQHIRETFTLQRSIRHLWEIIVGSAISTTD